MPVDPAILTKLDELLAAIGGYPDPRRASAEWKQAFKLLQSAGLPVARVNHVVGMRDLAALTELIAELRAPAPATDAPPAEAPDADTCRKALKAFRKRMKLTILDEQSQLGHGPLSKGSAGVAAIVPPNAWPDPVWQELVRQGKLNYLGHGFYELPK